MRPLQYIREGSGSQGSGKSAGRLPPRHIVRIALHLLRALDYEILLGPGSSPTVFMMALINSDWP